MQFSIARSVEILQRTPKVLQAQLEGLSSEWTHTNEGPDTWSSYDVIGHLIHLDQTNWLPRIEHILSGKGNEPFTPLDRFAFFEKSAGKSLSDLFREFGALRRQNIEKLLALHISEQDLQKTGLHPDFGTVTLSQLIATWVAHDLDHCYQINRVLAKQYTEDVGPWVAFLKALRG